jgi:hypothetical protein
MKQLSLFFFERLLFLGGLPQLGGQLFGMRERERAVEPFVLTKYVVGGAREQEWDELNISLLLVIPEVLEVDVLDRINMLLTGGLAMLHALDPAMAPHEFSLLLSRSTRHCLFDGSFCLFLSCTSSSV